MKTSDADEPKLSASSGPGRAARVEGLRLGLTPEPDCWRIASGSRSSTLVWWSSVASIRAALIELAGMLVVGRASHPKAVLQARLTTTPGAVHLIANATILAGKTSKKVSFNWQWSSDGAKTWNALPTTPLVDTLVTPMTVRHEGAERRPSWPLDAAMLHER